MLLEACRTILDAMRLLATLALVATFLFTVPGFAHPVDVAHTHVQMSADAGHVDTPMGKKFIDCHHGCGHSHAASQVLPVRVSDPVVWVKIPYSFSNTPPPESADPSPPYKPPRA